MARFGHRFGSITSVLALLGGVLLAPAPAVAAAACLVENDRIGTAYETLQEAVDAADDGDTLVVSGVCVGNTSILGTSYNESRSLRLVGVSSTGQPTPTLDGGGSGSVLTIIGQSGGPPAVKVVIRDLAIIGGKSGGGGGIRVLRARLTLRGDTTVTGNRAIPWFDMYWVPGSGGGISVAEGTLRLNDSASVTENAVEDEGEEGDAIGGRGGGISVVNGRLVLNDSASVDGNVAYGGGGIIGFQSHITLNDSTSVSGNVAEDEGGGIKIDAYNTLTLNDSASITGNTADGEGGGIYNAFGTVTLNDSASVTGNTANRGGGIYNETDYPSRVYVCSDEVAISPNDPDDPPKVRHSCP